MKATLPWTRPTGVPPLGEGPSDEPSPDRGVGHSRGQGRSVPSLMHRCLWRTVGAGGRQAVTVPFALPWEAVLSTDAPISDPALGGSRITREEPASVRDTRARIAGHLVGRER